MSCSTEQPISNHHCSPGCILCERAYLTGVAGCPNCWQPRRRPYIPTKLSDIMAVRFWEQDKRYLPPTSNKSKLPQYRSQLPPSSQNSSHACDCSFQATPRPPPMANPESPTFLSKWGLMTNYRHFTAEQRTIVAIGSSGEHYKHPSPSSPSHPPLRLCRRPAFTQSVLLHNIPQPHTPTACHTNSS